MELTKVPHPSVEERRARGKALRQETPPSSHAGWKPAADRADPVALLEEQNQTREADLVPVRHGRMMVSPFTFYRGAAKIMAADLKDTPRAGLVTQLCGDAHLSNFGVFASPERTLLFDLNDFDETLPGPFEYDLKRMAASFTIAARNNGFSTADERAATLASVTAYREAMAGFAEMGVMDFGTRASPRGISWTAVRAWSHGASKQEGGQEEPRRARKSRRRSPRRRTRGAACRHCQSSASSRRPLPHHQPAAGCGPDTRPRVCMACSADELMDAVHGSSAPIGPRWRSTASPAGALRVVDMARKVVGVGSVGTRAFIVLLQGRDEQRSAVFTGERSDGVSARGLPAQEQVQDPGYGSSRPANDAGGERHLPGLDEGLPRPIATSTCASSAT